MKKNLKKVLSIVMILTMVFAMSATAFADTNDNITVTVKFDTRSYDVDNVVMKTEANTAFGNSPVVTLTNISIPSGSTVQDVLEEVADINNLELLGKTAVDYYDPTITHTAITSIGQVGENYIDSSNPGIKSAFITTAVPTTVDSRGYYYESGWVYGLKTATGDEYFPGGYMDSVEVTNGMTITFHYSVTGCIDVNTGTWTSDYSNPDVTMWNVYDKYKGLDPDDTFEILAGVDATIAASRTASGNTTGLSAYYFSHNGITADNQLIDMLNQAISLFE